MALPGARYYDSDIGRWTSVDPLAEKYPGFSPYAYALDNPLKYFDLDGRAPSGGFEMRAMWAMKANMNSRQWDAFINSQIEFSQKYGPYIIGIPSLSIGAIYGGPILYSALLDAKAFIVTSFYYGLANGYQIFRFLKTNYQQFENYLNRINKLNFGKYEVSYAIRDIFEIYRGINTILLPPYSSQLLPFFDPSRTELARTFYYSGVIIGIFGYDSFYWSEEEKTGEVIVEGIFPVNQDEQE